MPKAAAAAGAPSGRLSRILRPEYTFAAIALVFGVALLVASPPFRAPDEYLHFYRAYDVSEGRIAGTPTQYGFGAWLPSSLSELVNTLFADVGRNPEKRHTPLVVWQQRDRPLNPDARVFTDFGGTSAYSPVPYLPQALGVAIGRVIGLSPLLLMYLGRLANLLSYVALSALAIRAAPIGKRVLAAVALTPMPLSLAASVSEDASTNAMAFLVTALALRAAFVPSSSSFARRSLRLAAACSLLLLCKVAYLPFLALFALIPLHNPRFTRRDLIQGLLIVAAACLLPAVWTVWAQSRFGAEYVLYGGKLVQPIEQLAGMLADPLGYIGLLVSQHVTRGFDFAIMSIGVLGWLDVVLPTWAYFSYAVVAVFVALADSDPSLSLNAAGKSILAAVVLVTAALLATVAYLIWTPVGADFFNSISGRFYIPLAPLVLLLLHNRRLRPLGAYGGLVVSGYSCVLLAAAVWSVVARLYA